ncbi:Uncharacterised protein [Mycobacterium tuberculosis]|nr:Uncharacterised protein [Mycobacterium tuberculosis]CPA15590.1 Uncharacterised protein [Mycobacterium tuberculosis]
MSGSQEPAVQPGSFNAGPGRRGGVFKCADRGGAHRRIGQDPQGHHIDGRELDDGPGLGLHSHRRIDG